MNTAAAKSLEIDSLAKNIQKLLLELENIFWDLSVSPPDAPSYSKYEQQPHRQIKKGNGIIHFPL